MKKIIIYLENRKVPLCCDDVISIRISDVDKRIINKDTNFNNTNSIIIYCKDKVLFFKAKEVNKLGIEDLDSILDCHYDCTVTYLDLRRFY